MRWLERSESNTFRCCQQQALKLKFRIETYTIFLVSRIKQIVKVRDRMMKYHIIFLSALLLIGCQRVEPDSIPLDMSVIKTEAVQTAIAEITVQAILNPALPLAAITSSPIPKGLDTETAEITETPNSTEVEIQVELTEVPVKPVYACVIDLSASLPKDGPQPAGEKIEKSWVIRNSGNVAWTTENVRIKWVGGVNLYDQDFLDWSGQVQPGDEYSIKINLSMPAHPTNKMQIVKWGLINPANEIFCKLYYLIPYVY